MYARRYGSFGVLEVSINRSANSISSLFIPQKIKLRYVTKFIEQKLKEDKAH